MGCGCRSGTSGCGACGGCVGCGTCGCNQTIIAPSICGVRPCSPAASCGTVSPATPSPYFASTPSCQEDHCQQITVASYATCISVSYAWNIPACGSSATLYFTDLKALNVGAYLWHPSYGYFEVTAFNPQTGQVTIVNNCNEDNAEVGTNVPACTCFQVTPTPLPDNDPTTFPFVAIDFTAPADGDCLLITVTSTNGLVVGGEIQIGDGTYLLQEINSPTTITICNDGEGITPGTAVIAKNEAGEYQYPIFVVGVSPCENDIATEGIVMVCDGDTQRPLEGSAIGKVPMITNATTNVASYQDVLAVSDSSTVDFTFVAAAVPPTLTGAVKVSAVAGNVITTQVDGIHVSECADMETEQFSYSDAAADASGIVALLGSLTSNIAEIDVSNTSACRALKAMLVFEFLCDLTITLGADRSMGFNFDFDLSIDGAAFVSTNPGGLSNVHETFFGETGANLQTYFWTLPYTVSLAAGGTQNIRIRMTINRSTGNGADDCDVEHMMPKISGVAFAV